MNERMDRSKFHIGTYFLADYAQTEQHVKDVADSGLDMIVCMHDWNKEVLDLLYKYHIGCCVGEVLPGWWGGDGDNAGKMEQRNPMEQYEAGAASFVDHPAIWGIDAGDEPSALDFPYYGKVMNWIDKRFPHQFGYLNLYPNYASVSKNNADETVCQLGTKTYAEHIDAYIRNVGTDYICYDFYVYSANLPLAYENLRIVSDACRRTGRSMWIVLQINSHREDRWLTTNQIRFQANTALAFGAETVIWACYTAGWWHHQALDEKGEKTPQYDKMQTVNYELRAIADIYMRYRTTETHFVGFDADDAELKNVNVTPVKALNTGVFFDVHAVNGEKLVIGQMVSRKEHKGYALFLAAADDYMDTAEKTYNVTAKTYGKNVTLVTPSVIKLLAADENGYVTFPMTSNGCAMLTVDA